MMIYSKFRELLASAIDQTRFPLAYLDYLVASGNARSLSTGRAAVLFELKKYPSGLQDLHGIVAAGNLDDVARELIPQAEAWGRANGCVAALIESRPGWARVLKDHGYETHQVSVRKVL